MSYIGRQPQATAITSADIADGAVGVADLSSAAKSAVNITVTPITDITGASVQQALEELAADDAVGSTLFLANNFKAL